jgi:hypothetical protein
LPEKGGLKIVPEEGETVEEAVFRVTGEKMEHLGTVEFRDSSAIEEEYFRIWGVGFDRETQFAVYNQKGVRIKTAEAYARIAAPTEKELANWDYKAKITLNRLEKFKTKYHLDPRNEVFIRFGRPPKSGKSLNHLTGEYERGISVYRGKLNPETGVYDFAPGSGSGEGLLPLLIGGKKPYLVSGEYIGIGSDGEPLLKNAEITHTLKIVKEGYIIVKKI